MEIEIDRVTELNILLFMQLAGLPEQAVTAGMYWQGEQFQTWLTLRNGRINISQCMPLEPFDDSMLLPALRRWQPANFSGIPQRIFRLCGGLVISCCPATGSTAEIWLQMHRRQQVFLGALCKFH